MYSAKCCLVFDIRPTTMAMLSRLGHATIGRWFITYKLSDHSAKTKWISAGTEWIESFALKRHRNSIMNRIYHQIMRA
jgi:hypothetical protein